MNKITTIIPAAGLATRLRPISNNTSKAMIPINGKPAISYIIDQAKVFSDDIRIVCGQSNDIINYCKKVYSDLNISFFKQDTPDGPLHAVRQAIRPLEDVEEHDRDLLVWLGDTIILDYKPSNNGSEVVYGEVDDWERWCLIDDYGVLHDKPSYNPRTNKALAGIYKLSNFSKITKAICNITKFEDTVNGEFQISQILEKCNNINQVKTTEWYDCGNFPSLYDTRAKLLNMLSRSDNYIWVDTTTGTITKSGKRCISEIEWYKDVPHNIKPFLPTVYDIDTEKNSYTMEYCPGTSLQDIFVFEQLKEDTIEYTLNKVLDTFDLCFTKQTSYKYRETSEASEYMWIEKNLQRFLDYNQYHFIEQDDLHYILNVVKSKSYKQIINDCNSINTIHGDLHFGNILFDYNIGKVKFIDPRGNWNNNDTLTGDIEYDIAKLYQSCYCEYMWIVNNLAINEVVKDKLVEILDSRFTNTRDHKIRACIMMASCLPFHNDNPVRQERIWNTSIRLLKELNIFED